MDMDPQSYRFVCNCLAQLISAGMAKEAMAFWAQNFPGLAMPTVIETSITEGTLISVEMIEAAIAGEEIAAIDAALTVAAVEVEVDAVVAVADAALAEADFLMLLEAAEAATIAGLRASARWIPPGRGLIIILAVGMFALHAATGSPRVAALGRSEPKKPDSIATAMRSLYSMYVLQSLMVMLANRAKKLRMYKFDEWRVQVFHPLMRKLRASAPERAKLHAKMRLKAGRAKAFAIYNTKFR